MVYDAAIIGSGPAGLSAALNLKLHNKSLIWFGAADMSEKVARSEKIANYPGMGLISGAELNAGFERHRQEMGLELTDRRVTTITEMGGQYMLLADNDIFEARTVLLTIGVVAAKGFAGEERLLGRGVSYCATCDGFLYKGKRIAVFCGAARYEHEVAYLAELAEKVYLFAPYGSSLQLPNVGCPSLPIKAIEGDTRVEGIRLSDDSTLAVDGVFCLRNAVAPGTLLPGLAMEGIHIAVDRAQATNLPGCYAAGDCTGRPYQIAKAVGEGNVAAHSMIEYLASHKD